MLAYISKQLVSLPKTEATSLTKRCESSTFALAQNFKNNLYCSVFGSTNSSHSQEASKFAVKVDPWIAIQSKNSFSEGDKFLER